MATDSHQVSFGASDVLRLLGAQLLLLCLIVLLVFCLGGLNWLPGEQAVQTTDEVLFSQRVDTARDSDAGIVLVGDSSCAVGVDAPALQDLLPEHAEVANQGLLMGLPMTVYAEAAAPIVCRRGDQPTMVVLLFTPESLTGSALSPYHGDLWRRLNGGIGSADPRNFIAWAAMGIGRSRIVQPLFPWVLHGRATIYLPHILHAERHLSEHQGTLVDRGWFNRTAHSGPPETRIQSRQLEESTGIRPMLGERVNLVAGLTPLPESMANAGYQKRRDALLIQWNQTLQADLLLTNLPARFPNGFCASAVHLNRRGQEAFTRLLAIELANHLPVRHEKK